MKVKLRGELTLGTGTWNHLALAAALSQLEGKFKNIQFGSELCLGSGLVITYTKYSLS